MFKQRCLRIYLDMIGCDSKCLSEKTYLAIFKLTDINNNQSYEYLVFYFPTIEVMFDELKNLAKSLNYNSVEALRKINSTVIVEYDEKAKEKNFIRLYMKKKDDAWPSQKIPCKIFSGLFCNCLE